MAGVTGSSSQPLLQEDWEAAEQRSDIDSTQSQAGTWSRRYKQRRERARIFLSSKTQHAIILGLVSLDVLGIFADIFLNLYECEEGDPNPKIDAVRNGLGIAGLVFSCLFLAELSMSIWAFGCR